MIWSFNNAKVSPSLMSTPAFSEIERAFARLSTEAQLSLLERLVHRARVAVSGCQDTWEADIAAMAADPEIQQELSRIKAEFGATEADGLERQ
ncbi:MAG: hypothetical protein HY360_10100 [Verrucomicrobia bacterium]|nr:hypothetical protein [Verrucomicrobiota bacterium]